MTVPEPARRFEDGAGPPPPPPGGPGGRRARPLAFADVALVALATIGLYAVLAVAVFAAAARPGGWGTASGMPAWAVPVLFLIEAVAITASVYVLLIRRRGLRWHDLGLRPTSHGWVAAAVATALACLAAAAIVTPVLDPLFEAPLMERYATQFGPEAVGWGQGAGILLVGGVMVPAAEEVLFRGILYGWLRQSRGVAASTLVSAGVFALAHTNPQVVLQIFLVGVALAYLYEHSGSLVPAIITHMTINATSLVTILFFARLWV